MPVTVDPPAPQIGSITAGGQTVTGSTTANNSSTSAALSFNITGAVAGATVSVYLDGGTTPIATGTVASGATTITLTTDGSTTIAGGSHQFTVQQSIATPSAGAYVGWSNATGQFAPGVVFSLPAITAVSPASTATGLTISS